MFQEEVSIALRSLLMLSLLTGVLYPWGITTISQAVFPRQANGSLILRRGTVVGSELIGQSFSHPKYFWGRLSATSPVAYNAASSTGSNLGPLNPALLLAVKGRISALRAADPENAQAVPVDLVTTSASGLDPHISIAAAYYQIQRVARVRGLPEATVLGLVAQYTQPRLVGVFGEPVVNVLLLNLALDELSK